MIRSWKTTLSGVLMIIIGALKLGKPHFLAGMDSSDYIFVLAVLGGIVGIAAKDSNVTGPSGPDTASK